MRTSSTGMPWIRPRYGVSAPSSRICAAANGTSGALSESPAMFVMQNVVTVPSWATSTSTSVGAPLVGSDPRGGRYTLSEPTAFWPMSLPSAMPRRYLLGARPALISYSSRIGTVMPVTGSPSSADGADGSSPSAIGTHASRSVTYPTRSAFQRGITRMPTLISSGEPTSTTCTIGTSAPSGRTSANANGFVRWCLPATGSATHVHASTTPAGPTSTNSSSASPVPGSYSVGGTITRPSAVRTPTMRPDRSPVKYRESAVPTERVYPPGYSRTWCSMSGSVVVIRSFLDRGLAVGPVRVPQLALQQLARGLTRQLVHEIERARPLELGEPAAQVLHDRVAQRVVGRDAGPRLDDRLDLLPHVVVGDAEHRGVGDVGVGQQLALDLGRVDVHATRDDHVGLAVTEEQVALFVQVADVADGEEAVGVVRVVGLGLVALVLEVAGGHLHPHGAGRPRLALLTVVVDDLERRVRPDRADGAGELQPLGRGGERATTLGRAVVLDDRFAPPVDHLALHVDRTRRCRMDRVRHRRDVVLRAHVVRQLQHAVELRRHHVRVGAAVLLDQRERLLRVPLVHVDDGVPGLERVPRERGDRGVVVRRRREVHVPVTRSDAEEQQEHREELGRRVGVEPGERTLHTLRTSGGAARVVHRRTREPVVGQRVRLTVDELVERPEPGHRSDGEAPLGGDPRLVGRGHHDVGEPLVGDEGLRVGVAQDVRDLRR